jgi:hypothetical protein
MPRKIPVACPGNKKVACHAPPPPCGAVMWGNTVFPPKWWALPMSCGYSILFFSMTLGFDFFSNFRNLKKKPLDEMAYS